MQEANAPREELESVVIRFAGDSGDGIQVTGTQFTAESAIIGNDISTLPDFPAEIRAPAGTLAGVSAFQINFGSFEIDTPGDQPDVLVAMNPASLRANIDHLKPGGILIANEDTFQEKNLAKVNYETNPLEEQALRQKYRVFSVPISKLTKEALVDSGLSSRDVERCKNFFTLGIMLWLFNRGPESTIAWLEKKFSKKPEILEANKKVLKAGRTYAEATEIFNVSYVVKPAQLAPGTYRNINGTTALAYGLLAATQKSGLPMFFGAYPITPASDLLHELARYKQLGVTSFQAEDEIAAICSAIGASFAGNLGVTSSSGPGIALKTEAINLAIITELPLVIINVQRGGPSTGLPTKTEQSDLHNAFYGRPGDAPLCVIAASSPSTAFELSYAACRLAIKYMTPVMFLTEGFIANSSEPWMIPSPESLPEIPVQFAGPGVKKEGVFYPYERDEKTLARHWAIPGTSELMHRIGGIEKADKTGAVSYDPANHHHMTMLRADKIAGIVEDVPNLEVDGEDSGDLLVVGWGGTEGTLKQAVKAARADGQQVSRIHLHYLNPFPANLGKILNSFKRVLLPEINTGQLRTVLRDKYLCDIEGLNLVRGQPLAVSEVKAKIKELLTIH